MSNRSQVITNIKSDDAPYKSFNAYTRPVRVHRSTSANHSGGVRIINLDPTDDASQVCEAYRQIGIKAQLRRIKNNELALAKKREQAAAEAKQAAIDKEKKDAANALGRSQHKLVAQTAARRKNLLALLQAGHHAVPYPTSSGRVLANKDICVIRQGGHDIAAIASGSSSLEKSKSVSLWAFDTFKRPSVPYVNPFLDRKDIRAKFEALLLEGYLVESDYFSGGQECASALRKIIAAMRKEGIAVCTVKNVDIEHASRGWIVPCAGNGLTPDKAVYVTGEKIAKA